RTRDGVAPARRVRDLACGTGGGRPRPQQLPAATGSRHARGGLAAGHDGLATGAALIEDPKLAELGSDPFVQTGVLAVVGAIITRVLLRRYPTRRLIFQLAFFVALTLLLYHHDIVPYEVASESTPAFECVFVALAKVIWWINAAWVLTGFTR